VIAKNTWALIVAATVAVASVTAAGFVLADHAPTSAKKITGTSADTPGLAWSLDAAEYLDRPFADFADPRGGSSFDSGQPGFILAGDTLMTIVGIPTEGYSLDDAVMIGVDADDGSVRWQAPAHDLVQCSETPLDGKIYCHALNDGWDLVTYDIETGVSVRRTSLDPVFALTTTADTLYTVEGNPEDGDVRVHSGTFDDVSANWTRSVDISGGYEDVYGSEVLSVTDGIGLVRMGIDMVQFDAKTGKTLWTSDGVCVRGASLIAGGAVVQANTDCETYNGASDQILRGPDGKVLVTATSSSAQSPAFAQRSDGDTPVLLGDSAFDPESGERLWTNPDLTAGDGSMGTVTAIVGGTIYLRNSADDSSTGIDLRTGQRLWHNDTAEMFTPSAVDGTVLMGGDGIELTAFDVRAGTVVWTAPFVAIDPDPETFASGGGAAERYEDTWIYSSDRRMIGLAPL
jgi:outer membrane protein assembly factor BamB